MIRSVEFFTMLCVVLLLADTVPAAAVADRELTFENVHAVYQDGVLTLQNGHIVRRWKWTGCGLATTSLKNVKTGYTWSAESNQKADWQLPGFEAVPTGELAGVVMRVGDDEGFTEKHIEVVAEVIYPSVKLAVKYKLWCYPNAAGIRTQLYVKKLDGFVSPEPSNSSGISKDGIKVSSPQKCMNSPENLVDGDLKTLWRTEPVSAQPDQPGEVIFDLGKTETLSAIGVIPPQDYRKQGCPEELTVVISADGQDWSLPVGSSEITRSTQEFIIKLDNESARYVKLLMPMIARAGNINDWSSSLTEVNFYTDKHPFIKKTNLRSDYIPVDAIEKTVRRALGYEMDNQFRNDIRFDYCRKQIGAGVVADSEIWDWANILCLEKADQGLMLVKESHKTAIEPGYLTGDFTVSSEGVSVTGWGLSPEEMTDNYRECWANWVIVYSGDEANRQLALKVFDRKRYPATLLPHKSINACTWGGGDAGRSSRNFAVEEKVLPELDSLADLGVECLLIDDGWQVSLDAGNVMPNDGRGWKPHRSVYTDGNWDKVVAKSEETGVNLSLWTAAIPISLDDLIWNQDRGGFKHWKFDFVRIQNYESKHRVEQKARDLIKKYDHDISIAWDLTESIPRFGLFWAREYGYIWLANRQNPFETDYLKHIYYRPGPVLKLVWEIAKNVNINKFEIVSVDVRQTPFPSNASLHSMEYAFAISMAGIPQIFDSTSDMHPESRKELKRIIQLYKSQRDQMFDSYVFPIGAQPNDDQITGFQFHSPDSRTGHLLIFRELYCPNKTETLQLKFISDKTLQLEDLRTGKTSTQSVTEEGYSKFTVERPADFLFLKYEVR